MRRHPVAGAVGLLARQRSAVRRLKRDLFGSDGSLRHPYFRDLRRDLSRPFDGSTRASLHAACDRADVVYVGDFHADAECQYLAARLLESMARPGRHLALGIEFVYTRQQEILDRRQRGAIDDRTFLRRIHYREEWGYPWDGFRDLLDAARALGVRVVALDRPPRGGFDGLRRRDAHAARGIASMLLARPRTAMMVLFGESHIAQSHLPGQVEQLLAARGVKRRAITVFQDPEDVYWAALARDGFVPDTVRLDGGSFAVFHTPPLARYECYRQVLERWRGEMPADEEADLTPAVHHLMDTLVGWMGLRPDRHRLRHRAGWVDDLQDAYPEVYSGSDAGQLLGPVLAEHGRSPAEIREARRLLAARDALYDARSNTFFLLRYLPGSAAGEAARFLRIAMSGRLHRDVDAPAADPSERMYGAAYNEALAYLGARLVDPASDFVAGWTDPQPSGSTTRARWLGAHEEFEGSSRLDLPPKLKAPLMRSRDLRRALARDLGRRLGRLLYERVVRGRISPRRLRTLFEQDLDPPRARREVLRLLRLARPWK
ncbi:MAG TPA: ChaN family lipoprotein [Candidatus Polarisedimenticolaceae bacterium]|nr:ChaN family lipoprotein [Candidatus Polarisedimenticolaceae bacterium]